MTWKSARKSTEPVASVQSVDRALVILELLARKQETTLSDLAVELGVHKSTVSRLVSVLVARGFVEHCGNGSRGGYRLGFSIVRLAGATRAARDLAEESRPICEPLAQAVNATVNVAIYGDGRAINVSEANGPDGVSLRSWVGQSCPAHASATGKVLLAWLTDDALAAVMASGLDRYTPHTITETNDLRVELEQVRQRGWAAAVGELEDGLSAVAAPVRNASGEVVAALSISGPTSRMSQLDASFLETQLLAAATRVSRRLGCLV